MNKRGRHLVVHWYILFVFIIILTIFFLGPQLIPTALFVYEEITGSNEWDFSNPGDYTYDDAINLSTESVQLIPTVDVQTTTTTTVSQNNITSGTWYKTNGNIQDKTTKINSIGNGNVEMTNNNSVIEVNFTNSLSNNDIISIYIKEDSTEGKNVYICDDTTGCDNGDFGQFTLPDDIDDDAWYNVTLSGISSAQVNFYIDSANKLKVDMVTSYRAVTTTNTTTTITYPNSAEVQTNDLQPTDWKRWETFTATEQLNGESVQYQYSTDSGSSWMAVPEEGNLSSLVSSKVRIKATLISEGSATPIVNKMTLGYVTQQSCIEEWSCTAWFPETCPENATQTRTCTDNNECGTVESKPNETQSCIYIASCVENWTAGYDDCQINDQKTKFYLDENNCGTVNNLPIDNGTLVNCDYCLPNWQEANGTCQPGNTLSSVFQDANNCFIITNLASDNNPPEANTYSCNYCALNNCTTSFGTLTTTLENALLTIDDINNTGSYLELNATVNLENTTVTIIEYNWSSKNNTDSNAEEIIPLNKYYEITSNLNNENINQAKLVFYYTDEEINSTALEESTLKIYYYNETSNVWEAQVSEVNMTINFVSALVPHLSSYGLFGEEKVTVTTSTSSSSSGGGGGGSGGGGSGGGSFSANQKDNNILTATKENAPKTFTSNVKSTEISKNELITQTTCNYILEVSLPQNLSLMKETQFSADVTNKGNCDVERMNLFLSSELEEAVEISPSYLESLKQGEKANVLIIRKTQIPQKSWFSFLTGSTIVSLTSPKIITGAVVLEGTKDNQAVFKQELAVNIEIPIENKTFNKNILSIGGLILLIITVVIIVIITLGKVRRKKNRKK